MGHESPSYGSIYHIGCIFKTRRGDDDSTHNSIALSNFGNIGHNRCIGKGTGAGRRVWITGGLEFVPLNVIRLCVPGLELVQECCNGAKLLDVVVEVHVKGIGRHAGSLDKVLLLPLAVLSLSGIEVLLNGCLGSCRAERGRIT